MSLSQNGWLANGNTTLHPDSSQHGGTMLSAVSLNQGTLTSQYPFDALAVGNYFTVYSRYQHARVAASEYGRKHGLVFSCRMQPDRTMRVYRVASDQQKVDQRGRQGKRRIDHVLAMPTEQEFYQWLATFAPGQSFSMPTTYRAHYLLMQAWCSLYAIKTSQQWKCGNSSDGTLLITRI